MRLNLSCNPLNNDLLLYMTFYMTCFFYHIRVYILKIKPLRNDRMQANKVKDLARPSLPNCSGYFFYDFTSLKYDLRIVSKISRSSNSYKLELNVHYSLNNNNVIVNRITKKKWVFFKLTIFCFSCKSNFPRKKYYIETKCEKYFLSSMR